MEALKQIRTENKLTQKEAAELAGISLRSYKSYENDANKVGTLKYKYLIDLIKTTYPLDEEHGLLELKDIKAISEPILKKYDVDFCYLFGSYAKNKATPESDVDLLICSEIKGLRFFGLIEELREALHKKVDGLDINQLKGNLELTKEILKDGIKIYG
ncbi:MAG: nucleotidyltransferase domain-containing protein [Bacillota bacterium]|nr:nucleotidyltransferase domain-containing protein [Bacillota bacterium]